MRVGLSMGPPMAAPIFLYTDFHGWTRINTKNTDIIRSGLCIICVNPVYLCTKMYLYSNQFRVCLHFYTTQRLLK